MCPKAGARAPSALSGETREDSQLWKAYQVVSKRLSWLCSKRAVSFGLLIRSVSLSPKGIGTLCVWAGALGSTKAIADPWSEALSWSMKRLGLRRKLLGNIVHDKNSNTEATRKKDLENPLLTIAIVKTNSEKLAADLIITLNSRTRLLPRSVVQCVHATKKTRKREETTQGCSRDATENTRER